MNAVHFEGIGHIVGNGHGEGVGFLKNHAHALTQSDHVDVRSVDVGSVEENGTFRAQPVDEIVHAVEGAEQGRLAATGGTDEGRDEPLLDAHVDVEKGLAGPVVKRKAPHVDQLSVRALLDVVDCPLIAVVARRSLLVCLGDCSHWNCLLGDPQKCPVTNFFLSRLRT